MRACSLVAAIAIVFGSVGAPWEDALAAPPSAASTPSPADLATAKKLFDTGLKLYKEGSFREALAAFQRANDIAPRASLQRNIAQCHRDLKDFAAAYDAYQALLARYGATMSAGDRQTVERAIDELALLTGTVRVLVTEPGAVVAIDGHDVGTTPMPVPVRVNLGPHTVTVAKAGFETIRMDIRPNGGDEVRVDGPLAPEVTTGHIAALAPPDAKVDVIVDGADVGPAPWEGDVKPGVHVVEAKGADRFAAPKKVEVARRERVVVALDLVPMTGRVQVDTHTTDASILVNGAMVGKGVWEGTLPAGEHEVRIEAAGFRPYARKFLVHAGETFVEDARLESTAVRTEGIYSGLAFFGEFSPSPATNDIAQACPTSSCDASKPLGGGLLVRAGYSFGWIAAEGLVLGAYDYSSASVNYASPVPSTDAHEGPARKELYDFHRFGGGGAVGVRVANKHPHLRFTAGTHVGAMGRGALYKRSTTSNTTTSSETFTSDTVSYTSLLWLFDVGVIVGWENGAKFHVGVMGIVEGVLGGPAMAPASSTQHTLDNNVPLGTPALGLANGIQVFLGPVLGFDFGL
jgi:hypothetical protein